MGVCVRVDVRETGGMIFIKQLVVRGGCADEDDTAGYLDIPGEFGEEGM